jgi:hypothetical protein
MAQGLVVWDYRAVMDSEQQATVTMEQLMTANMVGSLHFQAPSCLSDTHLNRGTGCINTKGIMC